MRLELTPDRLLDLCEKYASDPHHPQGATVAQTLELCRRLRAVLAAIDLPGPIGPHEGVWHSIGLAAAFHDGVNAMKMRMSRVVEPFKPGETERITQ